MARTVETVFETAKRGLLPKHYGSRPMVFKKDLVKKRKAARQNKKNSRSK